MYNHRVQLVCDDAFLEKVDDWRRVQPDLPNRSEAIRRLVYLGLNAARAQPPKDPTDR